MRVTLIGNTQLAKDGATIMQWMRLDDHSSAPDDLVEFAGRACYQSFNKPNEATRSNEDYLANIIKQQHFSVMEHASASFYVTGVSRSLTHELVRHRHLSFSQLSQRFVNEEDFATVAPPALQGDTLGEYHLEDMAEKAKAAYAYLVSLLLEKGLTRKEAREAARAVLPNMTETRLVVTGNFRAWRDVIVRRIDPAADAEIQEFARLVLAALKVLAPGCFQDMEV